MDKKVFPQSGVGGLKNIYKKSLAMELIRMGHDLVHTTRNRRNHKYQIFVFKDTPELIRDLLKITKTLEPAYAHAY